MARYFAIPLLILIISCQPKQNETDYSWVVTQTSENCIFPEKGCNVVFEPGKLVFICGGTSTVKESIITSNRIITSLYAGKQVFEITLSGDSVMVLTEKYSQEPIKIRLHKKASAKSY